MSKTRKLYYLLLLIAISVPILATGVQHLVYTRRASHDARVIAEVRLNMLQSDIAERLREHTTLVRLAVNNIELSVDSGEESDILRNLTGILMSLPSLRSIYYGTATNQMINASGWELPSDFDLRGRTWYMQAVAKGDVIYTSPFLNASLDAMIVTIACPVHSNSGELLGVVGADIELNTIINMIEASRITPYSSTYLFSGNTLIASTHPIDNDTSDHSHIQATIAANGEGTYVLAGKLLGDRLIYVPLDTTGWKLAVVIPWRDYFPHALTLWLAFAIISLSAVLITSSFFAFFQIQIAKPLLLLEETIGSIDLTDNYNERIPEEKKGGFSSLVKTINGLLDRAQSYSLELNASKAELELMNARLETAITEERAARAEVEMSQTSWRALFDNAIDAIAVVDKEHQIVRINTAFKNLFEYSLDDIAGKNLDDILAYHRYQEAVHLTEVKTTGDTMMIETTRLSRSGREIEVEVRGIPIIIGGETVGGYAMYTDISRRKESEKEILLLSQRDQLTGLYNRAFFDRMMRELDASNAFPVSLVMGDINGLKVINDAFGHATGDELLRRIAQIIHQCCRTQDIPARIGGDEFAILMPGATEEQAEDLLLCIDRMCNEQSEGLLHLSITLGVSAKTSPAEMLSHLFTLSEDRMYRRKLREGKSIRNSLIASLLQALEEKTRETTVHSGRMEELSRALAEKMGLSGSSLDDIHLLASLHDIGKIGIPDQILNKPGSLDPEEWEIMKKHSEIGYRIASATVELAHMAESILYHHERWDGNGYPQGLMGEEIPMTSRIINVADSYDAMTNHRAYRNALNHNEAMDEIIKGSGKQFDPKIVDIFVQLMSDAHIT